jgi:hypothetical protein
MENLQSKDISNEIVEISKDTSIDEEIILPVLEEVIAQSPILLESKTIVEEVEKQELKPILEEIKKEDILTPTKMTVCKIYLHLDKILLVTIISCAVLMKLIIDFPEFLIFTLISVIFTSAIAYGYLYPEKSMKVLERFMIMNMLVNPMAIGF